MPYRSISRVTLIVCAILIGGNIAQPTAAAEELYDQRLAELEESVAQLRRWRSRVHAANHVSSQSLYAGFSFAFTKLHYKEAFQGMVTDSTTGTQHLIPFEHGFELTPRVWLGYRSAKDIGFRASYWSFDHSGDRLSRVSDGTQIPSAIATSVIFPATIVAPFPGDQLLADSALEATTVDLEATYDLRVKRLDTVLGGGVRYARFDQESEAVVIPGSAPGAAPASLDWSREFEGIGPLFTAKGKLPIGCSGLYATGGMDLSFLFGDKKLRRSVVNDATPAAGPPHLLLNDGDEITAVYGARLGMGWRRNWRYGQCFVEGTYEGQVWTEGGSPTLTFVGFNGFALTLGISL